MRVGPLVESPRRWQVSHALLAVPARRRVGHLVAAEAAAHARQLVARGELELLDGAVALRAADVPVDVRLVVEEHVRARHLQLRHRVAVRRLVARGGSSAHWPVASSPGFTAFRFVVVGRVARVAGRRPWACSESCAERLV